MNPKVSIIIPCYKTEAYAKDAITSVLAQTYENIEIIVVNDGGSSYFKELVDEYNDDRIVYIYQENKGLSAARNTGISHATGGYLSFLDSDDVYKKDKIKRQVEVIGDSIGFCVSGHFFTSRSDVYISRYEQSLADIDSLKQGNCINVNTVLLPKKIVEEVGGFDENLKTAEDWDLWLRIAKKGYVFTLLPEMLAMTRIRTDSMQSQLVRQKKTNIEIYKKNFNTSPPFSYYMRLYGAYLLTWIPQSIRKHIIILYRKKRVYKKN